MTKITQAFIFAAGRGERMMPLTKNLPKPLIKVRGKALIDHIIEKLDNMPSIEKIIINGLYLADKLEDHLKSLNNSKIIFSKEVEKIETGGGLLFAQDKIDFNKPLLLINGDLFWQKSNNLSDIEDICASFDENKHDILLGLTKSADYAGYDGKNGGDFALQKDENNEFTGKLSKNGQMTHAFVGIQVINPKILQKIDEKCFSMSLFYKNAVKTDGILEKVEGILLKGTYFHVGTPESVKNTEKLINKN